MMRSHGATMKFQRSSPHRFCVHLQSHTRRRMRVPRKCTFTELYPVKPREMRCQSSPMSKWRVPTITTHMSTRKREQHGLSEMLKYLSFAEDHRIPQIPGGFPREYVGPQIRFYHRNQV